MKKELEGKIKRLDNSVDKLRIRRKDSDNLKVTENVFDNATLKALYTLSNKGIVQALGGSISTGKEANVFLADGEEEDIAIKIYRISSSSFRSMEDYILGDPRFSNIRHNKRDIVFAWTKKEFRNLMRAKQAGVRVPEPIITERNILIMKFMGENGKPYPLLKDMKIQKEDGQMIFETVIDYMHKLYVDANLVHGDLSEYNILIDPEDLTPVIIDMGQSVTLEHPRADQFLKRDIENIARYFKRYKIEESPESIYARIKEPEPEN
ncbi:serine/threonine protein kinase [Methanococcoides methylutens]|uniref:non-specific serine/threonine protein kinase n=1 Tax=Methanococcoides methylutens TaxID=2226 RepID=A0A099T5H7_METMT|nr:serine protein kinase RIO [Methanococcoides methylutens]KGK99413.1 serine/threonine protein kinase [Methanococcoides methylutens]